MINGLAFTCPYKEGSRNCSRCKVRKLNNSEEMVDFINSLNGTNSAIFI